MSAPHPTDDLLLPFGDSLAAGEALALEETVERLAFDAPVKKPSDGLRAKLLRKIQEPEAKPRLMGGFSEPVPGFHVLKSGEGKWRKHDAAGIQYKVLSFHPDTDAMTTLVRMERGATLPRHRHSREEQCWVLEGDVRQVDGGMAIRSGDFFRAMPGTDHEPITTDGGCLLLIIGAAHDERLS